MPLDMVIMAVGVFTLENLKFRESCNKKQKKNDFMIGGNSFATLLPIGQK
jgi:hypothetical protein